MSIENINFLAVLVSAVASFGLGVLWYSPLLFAKAWQKHVGISNENLMKGNMLVIFGTSFLLMLLMCFGLAMLLAGHSAQPVTVSTGVQYGMMAGLFLVAASIGINMLYQRKSFKLWLIDAGYQALYLVIAGAILGAWR